MNLSSPPFVPLIEFEWAANNNACQQQCNDASAEGESQSQLNMPEASGGCIRLMERSPMSPRDGCLLWEAQAFRFGPTMRRERGKENSRFWHQNANHWRAVTRSGGLPVVMLRLPR